MITFALVLLLQYQNSLFLVHRVENVVTDLTVTRRVSCVV